MKTIISRPGRVRIHIDLHCIKVAHLRIRLPKLPFQNPSAAIQFPLDGRR
jgi:hypothetical protein